MKYTAHIKIMPHTELLDPQGKTVAKNMANVDIHGVEDVRIGKYITMTFEAANETAAGELVESACKNILANVIMEKYSYNIEAFQEA